ncbi:MAG: hypothetical protein ACHQRJ_13355 [Alphaproteobacteria bacterium]
MKRTGALLVLAGTIGVALLGRAMAQETKSVINSGAFGCESPEVLGKLLEQRKEGDVAGFASNFAAALTIGECVQFRHGEQVTVISEYEAIARVHRGKAGQSYYTFTINLGEPPSSAGVAEDGPRGVIRICKQPDMMNSDYRTPVTVPARMLFWDFGPVPGNASEKWKLELVTLKPATLGPGVTCAIAPAAISRNSEVRAVAPSDNRYFEPVEMEDENAPLPNVFPASDTPPLFAVVIKAFE